jgi:hypothetical protein
MLTLTGIKCSVLDSAPEVALKTEVGRLTPSGDGTEELPLASNNFKIPLPGGDI